MVWQRVHSNRWQNLILLKQPKSMTKFKIAVLSAILTLASINAQAKYAFIIKSVPFWIRVPLETSSLPAFWAALIAEGAVTIAEYLAEPLDKYQSGIQHSTRSTSTRISWPDGDYPTRTEDVETVYDYNPFEPDPAKRAKWFIKRTWTVYNRDGTSVVTITYSQTPPIVIQFCVEDCHYKRMVLAGSHASDFTYESFEVLTGYCIRVGSGAWGRAVTAWYEGWDCKLKVQNDIPYHNPIEPYQDSHFTFIGPSSLGTSSMSLFKLKPQKYTPGMAEVNAIGVTTTWFRETPF